MRLYTIYFSVQCISGYCGVKSFPADMLRIERAYPVTMEDSLKILSASRDHWIIRLKSMRHGPDRMVMSTKWKDYNWRILGAVKPEEVKG